MAIRISMHLILIYYNNIYDSESLLVWGNNGKLLEVRVSNKITVFTRI